MVPTVIGGALAWRINSGQALNNGAWNGGYR
jgi:hypothetical protein